MKNSMFAFYNKIKKPTIFSIIAVFCCYLSLLPLSDIVGWRVCVILYFFAYISAKCIRENFSYFKNAADSVGGKLLLFLLFLYFNISIYGIVFLEKDGLDGFLFPAILYLPITMVWIVPAFLEGLLLTNKMIETPFKETAGFSLKQKIVALVALMAHYGIWLYAFNPCISSPDSGYLFRQAHEMGEVPMYNWHPPFYPIVLSFLVKICDSVTFLILVQCFFFSVLIVRVLDYLIKKGISKACAVTMYVVWGFAFNNIIQMITLWKDIPYMISILWLTFLLVQYLLDDGNMKRNWYIRFVIALIFTAFFRQNGILPAFATAIIMGIYFVRKKTYKAILTVIAFVLAVVMIEGPVYSYYKVEKAPGLKYFALANDLLGTYYRVSDPSEELIALANEITKDDPDHFGFDSYYTHYNSDALGHYSVTEFLSLYLSTWLEHPKIVTEEFMKRNTILWSVIKPDEEGSGCVNYLDEWHYSTPYEAEYSYRKNNPLTDILSIFSSAMTDNPLIYIFSWRTGIYSLILLFFAVHLVKKKEGLMLITLIPVVFNALALYASSGWTDYRYYWPIAVIAILLYPVIRIRVSGRMTTTDRERGA